MQRWAEGKRALVVEGGGLRGAFAVGVLRALLDRVGADAFDGIFAVSSGVFAATYFAASQGVEMENTWRNLVSGRQLVDYWNVFRGEPILRLDYLIDLFKGPVLLDVSRVLQSQVELFYVLTDYQTGEPAYFNAKRSDLFDLMRASSALPFVYPRPVSIDGRRYCDGGDSDPIPIDIPLMKGYQRILVVRTRQPGYMKKPRSKLLARLLFPSSAGALHAWMTVHHRYNETLRIISRPPAGVSIHSILPPDLLVGRLTRDRQRIMAAIEQGKREADAYLNSHHSFFSEGVATLRESLPTNELGRGSIGDRR